MKRLHAEVERVVTPLRANPWRKDRIREELLTHLTALYEDEIPRHAKLSQALAAALDRFGDPAELTRNLQASVPHLERLLWYQFPGHTWTERRPTETAVAHIFRIARYAAAWLVIFNVVTIVGVAAIVQFVNRRPTPERPPLINGVAFLILNTFLVWIVHIVLLPLCGELIRREVALYRAACDRRRRARHAGIFALGLLLATAAGTIVVAVFIGIFEPLLRFSLVTDRQFWLVIASAATVTLVLTIIQSWQQARTERQFEKLYAADCELAD